MKKLIYRKCIIVSILILSLIVLCLTGCKKGTVGEEASGTQPPNPTATAVPTEGPTSTPADDDDFSDLFPDDSTTAPAKPVATNETTQNASPTPGASTVSAAPTPTKTPVPTSTATHGGLTSATDDGNQNWGPLS